MICCYNRLGQLAMHADNLWPRTWFDAYENNTNPRSKHATENVRKTRGDVWYQNVMNQGIWEIGRRSAWWIHVKPRTLLTAAAMLKTKDMNQNPLTVLSNLVALLWKDVCKAAPDTPLNSVAMVDMFARFFDPCFWAESIAGMPEVKVVRIKSDCLPGRYAKHWPISMNWCTAPSNFLARAPISQPISLR